MSPISFTPALFFDIGILLFLLFSVVSSAKRGLVLTLCGLIALIVAFAGASFVADKAAPVVSPLVEPQVTVFIENRLTNYFEDHDVPSLDQLSDSQVAEILEEVGFTQFTFASQDDQLVSQTITALAKEITSSVTQTLVYCVLFLLSFLLLLVLWTILSHVLNLVTYLPVIHSLNGLGGALLGLLKGCFLLFICAFALKYLGNIIPSEVIAQSTLLRFFMTTNPVSLILPTVSLLSW